MISSGCTALTDMYFGLERESAAGYIPYSDQIEICPAQAQFDYDEELQKGTW